MRALGFCVSVAHAEFMAQTFREAGVPALAVSGTTSATERAQALAGSARPAGERPVRRRPVQRGPGPARRRHRACSSDRPKARRCSCSSSAADCAAPGTRRCSRSWTLSGTTARSFGSTFGYRALTGQTRRGLERDIERGFPFLPSGCQIIMDRQSQQIVLENIRSQVGNRWPQVVAELRSYGDQDLRTFLHESGLELSDVLRNGHSWTELRRSAGLPTRSGSEREAALLKRIRAFAHVDDPDRSRPTVGSWTTTRPRMPISAQPSSASRGCCSSRSGPTAAATNRSITGLAGSAGSRQPATRCEPSSTCLRPCPARDRRAGGPLRHVPLQFTGATSGRRSSAALDTPP